MGILEAPPLYRAEFAAFRRMIGGGGAWANPADTGVALSGGGASASHAAPSADGGTAAATHVGSIYDGGPAS